MTEDCNYRCGLSSQTYIHIRIYPNFVSDMSQTDSFVDQVDYIYFKNKIN